MMIVSVAMLVVSGVDMATGGNEASFDYGKKSMFLSFFADGYVFCSIMYTYIYNLPLHS